MRHMAAPEQLLPQFTELCCHCTVSTTGHTAWSEAVVSEGRHYSGQNELLLSQNGARKREREHRASYHTFSPSLGQ